MASLVNPVVQRTIEEAKRDPEAFWGQAATQVNWFRTLDKVFEPYYPSFRRGCPANPMAATSPAPFAAGQFDFLTPPRSRTVLGGRS